MQVCPPGLHLSLGIFCRCFKLIETACRALDMQLASESSLTSNIRMVAGPTYTTYVSQVRAVNKLKEECQALMEEARTLDEVANFLAVSPTMIEDFEADPLVETLKKETKEILNKRDEKVNF